MYNAMSWLLSAGVGRRPTKLRDDHHDHVPVLVDHQHSQTIFVCRLPQIITSSFLSPPVQDTVASNTERVRGSRALTEL